MSFESETAFIVGRFSRAGVITDDFTCKLPNLPFNIPQDAAYGEFHIMGSDPITMGGEGEGKIRTKWVSMIQLTVWVPEGKGTKGSSKAGDRFKAMFARKQGRDLEGELYRFKTIQSFAPSTSAGWAVQVFRIPFTREEVEDIPAGLTL